MSAWFPSGKREARIYILGLVNQAALDSSLSASSSDVQARFSSLIGASGAHHLKGTDSLPASLSGESIPNSGPHRVRHPIDGKLMVFVDVFICTGQKTSRFACQRFISISSQPPTPTMHASLQRPVTESRNIGAGEVVCLMKYSTTP